jgi:hypothetical protein
MHMRISKQRAKELRRQAEGRAEAQSFLVEHLSPGGALAACRLRMHLQFRKKLASSANAKKYLSGQCECRYAKPLVHKLISKQRAKELSRQAEDLAEAQSFLVKHLGPNGALAACGLHVQVRPRLRSVYSLYLRACKCMRERVSYGLPELIMEDRVCLAGFCFLFVVVAPIIRCGLFSMHLGSNDAVRAMTADRCRRTSCRAL